jgi:hypothetical protein
VKAEFQPFDGVLEEQHTTQDGTLYVRVALRSTMGRAGGGGAPTYAEFLFPPGDAIVDVRGVSGSQPAAGSIDLRQLRLSYDTGVQFDRNEVCWAQGFKGPVCMHRARCWVHAMLA